MNTTDQRSAKIARIAAFPPELRRAVADLTDTQLDTSYRDGGWTVRQAVHHSAHGDNHAGQITDLRERKGW